MSRQQVRYFSLLLLLTVLVYFYSISRPQENPVRYGDRYQIDRSKVLGKPKKPTRARVGLLFPASFPVEVLKLDEYIKRIPAFHVKGYKYDKISKSRKENHPPPTKKDKYYDHPMHVFDASKDINLDLLKCGAIEMNFTDIQVSKKKSLHTPHCDIVKRFIASMDRGDTEYLLEMQPYFDEQLRLQVKHDVCNKHWFRLAGSTVHLKEYELHMMVSRLAYSPDGSRNNPKFSFAYTQLYDKNWNEVTDLSLVVPSNYVASTEFFKEGEQAYTVVNFPAMLPVPFYHDYNDTAKYLGPEDPRVLLVKNPAGYEEPLIVFNAHHRKLSLVDDDEDDFLVKQTKFYRSMWMSWPWQFQVGKLNVDGLPNPLFDKNIYNKVTELQIKNLPRLDKQKNWTPMFSEAAREIDGHDKNIMFVYRWANLQVLKCDLVGDTGKCGFVYHLNDRLSVSSSVGPLRGGTQLFNINEMIQSQTNVPLHQIIPPGREIWVGFARAHLVKCGCGSDFYRPNMVVITKDSIPVAGGDGSKSVKDVFRLTHVSSFMSLNVGIIPWEKAKPYTMCAGTNALIPNGISLWTISSALEKKGKWNLEDNMALAISVSDSTVDKVEIRGLLSTLVNDRSLFLPPGTDGELTKEDKERLYIPDLEKLGPYAGFGNDHLVCAMRFSTKFCSNYGHEKISIERQHKVDSVDFQSYDVKMMEYLDDLDTLGLDY